ncbi:hypothetical protein JW898_04835 [Candidatus Woesearchaeota archaeon]|nr:hypothetical protein [Candidatus Woesearchaeota archaeon]
MVYFKVAPLKSSFALAAILGFVLTIIYTDRIGEDWAFALGFVFALMFVASMISMKKAPIEATLEMSPDLTGVKKGRPKRKAGKKKK